MNGIDEAALDNLSLVTEMTKHIRVRTTQGATTADELGRFSPLFVWLLRVRIFHKSNFIKKQHFLLPGWSRACAI